MEAKDRGRNLEPEEFAKIIDWIKSDKSLCFGARGWDMVDESYKYLLENRTEMQRN